MRVSSGISLTNVISYVFMTNMHTKSAKFNASTMKLKKTELIMCVRPPEFCKNKREAWQWCAATLVTSGATVFVWA